MNRFITIVLLLFFTSSALAQVDLEVNILSPNDGKPLPSIEVLIENPTIGYSNSSLTNSFGKVIFKGLSLAGSYRVFTKESADYLEAEANGIELRSNFKRSITLVIPKRRDKTLDELVVTASRATAINTINAEVSSEINIKKIQELPVEGRDITRMLFRLPNVSQSTGFYPEAPNVSINGANGLYNNYMIDGMDGVDGCCA